MAKFLTTSKITAELEEIIKNANERLILISPYLKTNERIREHIEERIGKIIVTIIYGKTELQPEENKWLRTLDTAVVRYRKNLHAKCYLNEKTAMITSMNLHDFSQSHNDEMGVLITKEDDPELYADVRKEVDKLLNRSERVKISIEKIPENGASRKKGKKEGNKKSEMGHCIRCGKEIELDPLTPYCKSCYASWAKYKNPDYEEKYCHICGMPYKSTMNKPVCKTCWTKYKDKLNFPSAKKKK